MADEGNSVEVSNPTLGSLKIRGTDWIGIVSLILIVAIGAASYTSAAETKAQSATLLVVLKDLSDAQKDANKQGKLLACIVSRPEVERRREFESDNSFCQRFAR